MAEEDPPPPQELLVNLAPMATASADHLALEKGEKRGDFNQGKMVIFRFPPVFFVCPFF
jgi:hypothetical protein